MDVRASGHQQVLRLSNYNEETSLYRPKLHTSTSSLRIDTASSGAEGFEAITEDSQPSFLLDVVLEGIGVSLVNRRVIEVVYLSLENLKLDYSASSVAQSVNLSCGALQIDNQLHDATFPVVLQPTPIASNVSNVAALPTVQLSLLWLNDQGETNINCRGFPSDRTSFRTRCAVRQVLLNPAASFDYPSGRGFPLCNI
jgi:vacuolar protein sorting-associated protein 13A/C